MENILTPLWFAENILLIFELSHKFQEMLDGLHRKNLKMGLKMNRKVFNGNVPKKD